MSLVWKMESRPIGTSVIAVPVFLVFSSAAADVSYYPPTITRAIAMCWRKVFPTQEILAPAWRKSLGSCRHGPLNCLLSLSFFFSRLHLYQPPTTITTRVKIPTMAPMPPQAAELSPVPPPPPPLELPLFELD